LCGFVADFEHLIDSYLAILIGVDIRKEPLHILESTATMCHYISIKYQPNSRHSHSTLAT
jgi:hypothetical protein